MIMTKLKTVEDQEAFLSFQHDCRYSTLGLKQWNKFPVVRPEPLSKRHEKLRDEFIRQSECVAEYLRNDIQVPLDLRRTYITALSRLRHELDRLGVPKIKVKYSEVEQ